MSGVKGRSGRKSLRDEEKRLRIIDKAWEVEKLAGKKRLSGATDIISEEFLCPFDVLSEFPYDVNVYCVRRHHTSYGTCWWLGQPSIF